jgi:hypothetical protein
MNFKKALTITALSLATMGSPANKAEAGLLLWNPAMIILGTTGVLTSMVPYITDYRGATHSRYHRFFPEVFMLFGAVAFLDQDLDTMTTELGTEYPTIPSYIIKEATMLLKQKAEQVEFNSKGFKSVAMSEAEFKEFEKAMGPDVSPEELLSFKKVMTTAIELDQ